MPDQPSPEEFAADMAEYGPEVPGILFGLWTRWDDFVSQHPKRDIKDHQATAVQGNKLIGHYNLIDTDDGPDSGEAGVSLRSPIQINESVDKKE
jgi:hypothetical protein